MILSSIPGADSNRTHVTRPVRLMSMPRFGQVASRSTVRMSAHNLLLSAIVTPRRGALSSISRGKCRNRNQRRATAYSRAICAFNNRPPRHTRRAHTQSEFRSGENERHIGPRKTSVGPTSPPLNFRPFTFLISRRLRNIRVPPRVTSPRRTSRWRS